MDSESPVARSRGLVRTLALRLQNHFLLKIIHSLGLKSVSDSAGVQTDQGLCRSHLP